MGEVESTEERSEDGTLIWPFSFKKIVTLTWPEEDGPFVEAPAAKSFVSYLMNLVAPGYPPTKWSVKSVTKCEVPEETKQKSSSGQDDAAGPQQDSGVVQARTVSSIRLSIEFKGAADAEKFATLIKRVKILRRQNPVRTEHGLRPLVDPAEHAWL